MTSMTTMHYRQRSKRGLVMSAGPPNRIGHTFDRRNECHVGFYRIGGS
jgi:hypothetical protein